MTLVIDLLMLRLSAAESAADHIVHTRLSSISSFNHSRPMHIDALNHLCLFYIVITQSVLLCHDDMRSNILELAYVLTFNRQ